ncbi:MAG TPA: plasma-membrane proton-efflux P-type ATPase [Candidatus Micrarchaeaceae archaeon]|nr:plasma-membrane proton-efflux P-type ATPase [Candidatus Micrarchaeaceae archaeon]
MTGAGAQSWPGEDLTATTVETDAPERPGGLSGAEAERLLQEFGPNVTVEERPRIWRSLVHKLWAPVPWMLEATILLELWLGKTAEAAVVAVLLAFNAFVSIVQEGRAQAALALLRQRLTVLARVRRDGRWQQVPSRLLVPGDVVHLRVGDVTPADVGIETGNLQADQSVLTGESVPVERQAGGTAYAGSVITRGEATGTVAATGSGTFFGRTAELVRTARTASHLETVIMRIVRNLVALDLLLAVVVLAYTLVTGGIRMEVLSFAVVLLLASVPVALPATFALASALGSLELTKQGILVTRLSAIEEAASLDVFCIDKTGTVTANQLEVTELRAYLPRDEAALLRLASAASDVATQDPIDLAILARATETGVEPDLLDRLQFLPFDPATKRSEAVVREGDSKVRALKGAPSVLADLCSQTPASLQFDLEDMGKRGLRVLAVATGSGTDLQLVGLIGLQDPPRPDSKEQLSTLLRLGVRPIMVTGDGPQTARAIADQVGLHGRSCDASEMRQTDAAEACSVFAGVLPEDKFTLVKSLQAQGHVVGMTGDGVNDAPALRQAEVGVAVANAADVAKAAASMVLIGAGLSGLVTAIESSRRIYQRMLTYALNASVKKMEIPIFLSIILLTTGRLALTPLLMVLLLFTNDFAAMAITTDSVSSSQRPNRWRVSQLLLGALGIAIPFLIATLGVFWLGLHWLRFDAARLQTLIFLTLVFTSQATIYLVREPRRLWSSRPSLPLLAVSTIDIGIVILLASMGWFMAPVGLLIPLMLLVAVAVYALAVDSIKMGLFQRLHLHEV